MILQADDPSAIPLWINGRAYLTMAPAFLDVRSTLTGRTLRRTPLCGAAEALVAVDSASSALALWCSLAVAERAVLLAAVGGALSSYAGHFCQLIVEEAGKTELAARDEVTESVASLCGAAAMAEWSGVVAVIGGARHPLSSALALAVPPLMAGATVVVRPSPETPSALFALAELTCRCGFPAGVFNILHGGDEAVSALGSIDGVRILHS